jgi:cystathionine beta-lyase/cystathionine gamma-synthase
MHFRTRAIHVGQQRDPQTGAVVPPRHLASTFVQPGAGRWGGVRLLAERQPDAAGV